MISISINIAQRRYRYYGVIKVLGNYIAEVWYAGQRGEVLMTCFVPAREINK